MTDEKPPEQSIDEQASAVQPEMDSSQKPSKSQPKNSGMEKIPFSDRFVSLVKGIIKAKDMPETKEAFRKFGQKYYQVSMDGEEEEEQVQEQPEVFELPLPDQDGVIASYWLIPPHAYATIQINEDNQVQYSIIEPKVTENEYHLLGKVTDYLRRTEILDVVKTKQEVVIDRSKMIKGIKFFDKDMPQDRIEVLVYYLTQSFSGYGKLDAMLRDDRIEDITCNGSEIPLYLYHRDHGNIVTNCIFEEDELNRFVLKLAQKADKQLSLTSPLVDAALPSGARAQITYTDVVTARGSSFTIRKFKEEPMTPIDLIRWNTYSSEIMAYIWLAVENRKSIIVAGGTASGKTSTTNAISFFIPAVSKIVSIEDTLEIQLPHKNWLSMKTRENALNDQTSISMFSLLKAALRQRPEYIIMGEVRGEEAQSLFQAMNSGHTTFSTLHAGSTSEIVNRLTHDPINVPLAMFGALDLVIVQNLLYQDGVGFRRATALSEVCVEKNDITFNELFTWDNLSDTFKKVFTKSNVFDKIKYQRGWTDEQFNAEIAAKKAILEELAKRKTVTMSDLVEAFGRLHASEEEDIDKDV